MTAPAANPDLHELVGRLTELTERAARAVEAKWLAETSGKLMAAILELGEYRDGDPRHQKALALAQRLQRARRAGASIPQLMEQFDRSRPAIYRLLSVSIHRETLSVSTQPRPHQKGTG